MAVFTVLNGTGINGNGVQFGTIGTSIAPSGIAGNPSISPTSGTINFVGGGRLSLTGTGMSFTPPSTFTGTVDSMTYSKPAATPVFSITGMNILLSTLAGLVNGGDEETILAVIFSGDDRIFGSSMADTLKGYDGNDTLRGGAGGDNLDGGNGSDFANYQGSDATVNVNLLANTASGGHAQGDTLTNIENLYGSSHNDILTGNDVRNIIGGELGDDTLVGNGGDDSLSGEAGTDSLDGGDGNDRLVGGAGADTIVGSDGNDSVDAGADNDSVSGGAGNDALYGGTGDDTLDGGDGNDILEGNGGADAMTGGAGIDTVSYAGSALAVTVVLGGTSTGGDAEGDTLSSDIEQVMGSAGNDSITGDASANTLWGLGGDDVLTGGGGADVLKGGAGDDSFRYVAVGDSTVAAAGKDAVIGFTTGDKIDLSPIDADGNSVNGDTAFSFDVGNFTGVAGQVRVVAFANSRYGVYLDVNGDKQPDSIISVYSDHALTAADFVL
ncbi:calcium-binding protein [Inquilinus sp. Marseille-Q2685]|uniref:calcium-binding protein n=1 Tax=Inquilinus sp. Marseille-Q2685 TaxID=2866581 RepID=UPI001CE44D71|nr:calcium-binding protein [Inquilinus sp. Marseille-Q2685]